MIQLDDKVYAKLRKDADDNRQVINFGRLVLALIVFLLIFVWWGKPMLDLDIKKRQATAQCEIAIIEAQNNVRVKTIESEGMTFDEYIRWLNTRKKG